MQRARNLLEKPTRVFSDYLALALHNRVAMHRNCDRSLGFLLVALAIGGAACSAGIAPSPYGNNGDGGVRGPDSGRFDNPNPGGGPGGGPGITMLPPVDPMDPRLQYCNGAGPTIQLQDNTVQTTVQTCSGAIADRVFTYAVCTCDDTEIAGFLSTRSFDSYLGTGEIAQGGPVGVNDSYVTAGYADIGGSFTVAGANAVQFAGYLAVGGDMRFGGDLTAAGYIRADRDAYFAGNVTVPGYMEIHGDLHQPLGMRLLTVPNITGQTHSEGVAIPPPCACGANDLVDVGRLVDMAATNNDNASVSLDPNALASVLGIGQDLTLPCGRFYLNSIGGVGAIHLVVHGRTALFVGGDVNAIGAIDVDLGESGELDLFIKGNLVTIGATSFGDRNRPAASRIYVGGQGEVVLVGAQEFVGNLYAPQSLIRAPGATSVRGSLFGRNIQMPGYLNVVYDRDIIHAGDSCDRPRPPPPPQNPSTPGGPPMTNPSPPPSGPSGGNCNQCSNSCGNHACTGPGTCGNCATDADCCAPLVCYPDGTCGSLLI